MSDPNLKLRALFEPECICRKTLSEQVAIPVTIVQSVQYPKKRLGILAGTLSLFDNPE